MFTYTWKQHYALAFLEGNLRSHINIWSCLPILGATFDTSFCKFSILSSILNLTVGLPGDHKKAQQLNLWNRHLNTKPDIIVYSQYVLDKLFESSTQSRKIYRVSCDILTETKSTAKFFAVSFSISLAPKAWTSLLLSYIQPFHSLGPLDISPAEYF